LENRGVVRKIVLHVTLLNSCIVLLPCGAKIDHQKCCLTLASKLGERSKRACPYSTQRGGQHQSNVKAGHIDH